MGAHSWTLTLVLVVQFVFYSRCQERSFVIDKENKCFLKDNKFFRYISGEIDYFRVPRAYWKDRLHKMRMAGLNTIASYVEWSGHEPQPGKLNFVDNYDVVQFCKEAQREDLLVILRVGPYICGERDNGGFPSWLYNTTAANKFRTTDKSFMDATEKWLGELLPRIKETFYRNGGSVIALQIENEYGIQMCDSAYMPGVYNIFKKHVEGDVILANGWIKKYEQSAPMTFKDMGQDYGFVMYTAKAGSFKNPTLVVSGIKDRAYVGITGRVTLNGYTVEGWTMEAVPVVENRDVSIIMQFLENRSSPEVPGFFHGRFTLPPGEGIIGDTFLDPTGWRHGVAFINGINLGRYWPKRGPQVTLYLPGPFMLPYPGENRLFLLEMEVLQLVYFSSSQERSFVIDKENKCFLKDNQFFRYICGQIDYFRVPRAYWQDRLHKIRMAGLNTIASYVEWSGHEPQPGKLNFVDNYDLIEFCKEAQREDLLVILRVGPYICGERDNGGFPSWLYNTIAPGNFRTTDKVFMDATEKWLSELLPRIKGTFYKNGGSVIALQVENEYGIQICQERSFVIDKENKCFLKDNQFFRYISGEIDYFRVPRAYWKDRLHKMRMAGLNTIASYVEWSGHEPQPGMLNFVDNYDLVEFCKEAQREDLLVILRVGPYICGERDNGGFPSWLYNTIAPGNFRTTDKVFMEATEKWLGELLPRIKGTFYKNGGSVIALQVENEYGIQIYDYSAPLSEAGDPRNVYHKIRDIIKDFSPLPPGDGITGPVTLDGYTLEGWTMEVVPVVENRDVSLVMQFLENRSSPEVPGFFHGRFTLPPGEGIIGDTFLDPTGWKHGVAFINGINLGRYWPKRGPQVTLYLPGAFMLPYPEVNRLFLLEMEGAPENKTVKLVDKHVINGTV
ncbi:beta-galactosidase-like [Ixodes scapularis]